MAVAFNHQVSLLPCRYDDLKSASENIELQTTILSRFDLIFIVRDVRTEEHDMKIATYVPTISPERGLNVCLWLWGEGRVGAW